jgi:hypothetical protein
MTIQANRVLRAINDARDRLTRLQNDGIDSESLTFEQGKAIDRLFQTLNSAAEQAEELVRVFQEDR